MVLNKIGKQWREARSPLESCELQCTVINQVDIN